MVIRTKHIIITGALVGIGVLWYKSKVDKWKEDYGKIESLTDRI
ncbi:MAG: hypothetical protein QM710_14695 [Flavobacterium sp.]